MPIATPRRARGGARGKAQTRTPFLVAAAVAIVVTASLAGWLSYMVLNARSGSTHTGSPHATAAITPTAAHATPSATAAGTATPKASPGASATPNAQTALNNEAAASFRTAFLGTYPDQSCTPTNGTNQFSAGQAVYLNLCTTRTVAPGPMTAVIRQNGAVIFTLASSRYLAPGASYYFYSSYNLSPGNYDVLVTMTLQGHTATARTLYFTVS